MAASMMKRFGNKIRSICKLRVDPLGRYVEVRRRLFHPLAKSLMAGLAKAEVRRQTHVKFRLSES